MSTTRAASDVLDGQAAFSREELVDLSFLRVIAEVNTIRKELRDDDFERLPSAGRMPMGCLKTMTSGQKNLADVCHEDVGARARQRAHVTPKRSDEARRLRWYSGLFTRSGCHMPLAAPDGACLDDRLVRL